MTRYVIVGAGQAGLQLAEGLRRGGFEGELLLLGDEPTLPYQRPPLSKKYLLNEVDAARLLFRPADHFAKLNVEVRLATQVSKLERATRELVLAEGSRVRYDRLALTTGARVRLLSVAGAADSRVCYLRGLADAERIKLQLASASRVAIIGGGFIGLEVAAIARHLSKEVTVIEAQSRVLQRVVAPAISSYFHALHTGHGVRILLDQQVNRLVRTAECTTVVTDDGTQVEADLIVVGIGVVPNVELAEAAGLDCNAGIVVDEFACTSDPAIVAAGDCTRHRNLLYALPHRLESVQNAVDQAKVAAGTLLGTPLAYAQVPWFWSDQYDVKLQMVGISTGYDDLVLRGVPTGGGFSAFYFAGESVIAVDSINRPAEHMAARKLIAAGGRCTKAQVADLATDLKSIL
jgi:3-phenylpropionate/trans-cinnamate dioxygenase ferredoxin reductase component